MRNKLPPSLEDQKKVYLETQRIVEKYNRQYGGKLTDGLECIDCMHNVAMFPGKESYRPHYHPQAKTTTYEYPLAAYF